MSSRWWFPFDGMEEMSFKRVPEGWVYRVPNPWLVGRSRYYLVSEKQKSEIAGHHRRMWHFLLLGIAVIAAAGAPLSLAGFDEQQVVLSLATAANSSGVRSSRSRRTVGAVPTLRESFAWISGRHM